MKTSLIIGYGSIGRRHGQVLNSLGNEVAFIRTGKGTIKDDDFLKDIEIFTHDFTDENPPPN